jgi:hypothetical protein
MADERSQISPFKSLFENNNYIANKIKNITD